LAYFGKEEEKAKKVLSIQLGRNKLTKLSAGMFSKFPYVEKLNFLFDPINEIHTDVFKGLTKLKFLDLGLNQLDSIPAEAFQHLPNLQFLDLMRNKIRRFS
jgi:Leucine-rich repeat (LRR) protein